jgi:hypothetical protein
VVQAALGEKVRTLAEAVVVAVPVMGVTKIQGTEGGVTVKYPVPELMANVEVPDEVHALPCVHDRLMVVVPAVSDVACKELEQSVNAHSTGEIQTKWSLFIAFLSRLNGAGA